ncbi:uncharacterized protein LOC117929291 isoform X2 [Vitis riparia]|uniref:uncharacterized protein LOC117929291 isoform X2 n=1 Tax=Vitis riparia TaxID=96939 RepID=UPI00155AB6A5|nr:uncharacterized protein LOC117929291 isoform X2 [Vitis riparia]
MEMLLDRLVSFDLLKRLEKVLLKIHVVVNKAEEKQICISEEVVIDVVYWLTIFSSIFHNSMQICSAYGVERSKDKKGFISFMNMCILSDYWKFCLLLHVWRLSKVLVQGGSGVTIFFLLLC